MAHIPTLLTADEETHKELSTVESTLPSDWHYIAEGGANIVFAYSGLLQKFSEKVLRIRKRVDKHEDGKEARARLEVNAYWQEDLLPLLLGRISESGVNLLPDTRRINVQPGWAEELLKVTEKDRPVHRLGSVTSGLELREGRSWMSLTDNLLGRKGDIAVEIKTFHFLISLNVGLYRQ